MEPQRFSYLLKLFGGPMEQLELVYESEAAKLLTPWQTTLRGPVSINGIPMVFECEIDLRTVKSADHVTTIAGKLLESFEQAAKRPEARVH